MLPKTNSSKSSSLKTTTSLSEAPDEPLPLLLPPLEPFPLELSLEDEPLGLSLDVTTFFAVSKAKLAKSLAVLPPL